MDKKENKYETIINGINMDDKLENIISLKLEQFDEFGSGFKAILTKKSSFMAIIGMILLGIIFILAVAISTRNMYPISPNGVVESYFEALEKYDYEQAEGFVGSDSIINYLMFDFDIKSNRTIYKRTKDDEDKRACSVKVVIEYSNNEVGTYILELRKIYGRWYIFNLENIPVITINREDE